MISGDRVTSSRFSGEPVTGSSAKHGVSQARWVSEWLAISNSGERAIRRATSGWARAHSPARNIVACVRPLELLGHPHVEPGVCAGVAAKACELLARHVGVERERDAAPVAGAVVDHPWPRSGRRPLGIALRSFVEAHLFLPALRASCAADPGDPPVGFAAARPGERGRGECQGAGAPAAVGTPASRGRARHDAGQSSTRARCRAAINVEGRPCDRRCDRQECPHRAISPFRAHVDAEGRRRGDRRKAPLCRSFLLRSGDGIEPSKRRAAPPCRF